MNRIYVRCPVCGDVNCIDLNDSQYDNYMKWKRKELLIQEALPELSDVEREMLLSGFCATCWDDLFKIA